MSQGIDLNDRLARLDKWAADPVVHLAVQELATLGRWKEALDRARKAIRSGVDKNRVLGDLAEGALEGGRGDRAIKALEQKNAAGRAAPEAQHQLARAHQLMGDDRAADAIAERAWLDDPTVPWAVAWRSQDLSIDTVKGSDPLDTLDRIRDVADLGFPGRALRLARRLRIEIGADEELDELVAEMTDRYAAEDVPDPVFAGAQAAEAEA